MIQWCSQKVNATKTKVVRLLRSKYLGKTESEYLKRAKATTRPLAITIKRVNEIVREWINYFRKGMMKLLMEEIGAWIRHKIRVILIKQ